jgi:hypothetical protein
MGELLSELDHGCRALHPGSKVTLLNDHPECPRLLGEHSRPLPPSRRQAAAAWGRRHWRQLVELPCAAAAAAGCCAPCHHLTSRRPAACPRCRVPRVAPAAALHPALARARRPTQPAGHVERRRPAELHGRGGPMRRGLGRRGGQPQRPHAGPDAAPGRQRPHGACFPYLLPAFLICLPLSAGAGACSGRQVANCSATRSHWSWRRRRAFLPARVCLQVQVNVRLLLEASPFACMSGLVQP